MKPVLTFSLLREKKKKDTLTFCWVGLCTYFSRTSMPSLRLVEQKKKSSAQVVDCFVYQVYLTPKGPVTLAAIADQYGGYTDLSVWVALQDDLVLLLEAYLADPTASDPGMSPANSPTKKFGSYFLGRFLRDTANLQAWPRERGSPFFFLQLAQRHRGNNC